MSTCPCHEHGDLCRECCSCREPELKAEIAKLRAKVEEQRSALSVANMARKYLEREMRNMQRREQDRLTSARTTPPKPRP